jgi:zinc/manganese transport system permease protein
MFAGFMIGTWEVAALAALIAGAVGFFVVLRGAAFPAHAIPNGAFAGAAAALLGSINPLIGLGAASGAGALALAALRRGARSDVATALVLSLMLALGSLLLSFHAGYQAQIYALLFGEVLGVSSQQIVPTAALAAGSLLALGLLYRPLLLSAALSDAGAIRGRSLRLAEPAFLLLLALATTMSVPVVGAALIFGLMVGPPAAARSLCSRPGLALLASIALTMLVALGAVALAYLADWPVGPFVGLGSALVYVAGRLCSRWRRSRRPPP